MKKATKSVTTPATPAPVPAKTKKSTPATKAAQVPAAEKPAPAKKAPAKKKASVIPAASEVVTPVVAAPAAPAPAPVAKAPAKAVVVTTITAQIDVGFGNALYLRGEGPGLSWEKGVLMDCVADDRWIFTLTDAERPVVFKFLLNDITWSTGEDYVAAPGASTAFTPAF
ncbi:MAG: hypothetical protein SFV32_11210 [Opitutaceae bacterium]|nr:hypothetical protein [Opitutaceae bacterium]